MTGPTTKRFHLRQRLLSLRGMHTTKSPINKEIPHDFAQSVRFHVFRTIWWRKNQRRTHISTLSTLTPHGSVASSRLACTHSEKHVVTDQSLHQKQRYSLRSPTLLAVL